MSKEFTKELKEEVEFLNALSHAPAYPQGQAPEVRLDLLHSALAMANGDSPFGKAVRFNEVGRDMVKRAQEMRDQLAAVGQKASSLQSSWEESRDDMGKLDKLEKEAKGLGVKITAALLKDEQVEERRQQVYKRLLELMPAEVPSSLLGFDWSSEEFEKAIVYLESLGKAKVLHEATGLESYIQECSQLAITLRSSQSLASLAEGFDDVAKAKDIYVALNALPDELNLFLSLSWCKCLMGIDEARANVFFELIAMAKAHENLSKCEDLCKSSSQPAMKEAKDKALILWPHGTDLRTVLGMDMAAEGRLEELKDLEWTADITASIATLKGTPGRFVGFRFCWI